MGVRLQIDEKGIQNCKIFRKSRFLKEKINASSGYCENLLKFLFNWDVGLDISDYENCTYLHDMNED